MGVSSLAIKTALISVSDKTNIDILLNSLKKFDVKIISTGGTARKLKELGYECTEVSEITGSEEYPDGLVKTLHPKIHFAILFDRENPEHVKRVDEEKIQPIDMVVCNLYPFERTVKKQGVTKEEATANIDIGGVAMIRAAAKNHKYVSVVTGPESYRKICDELEKTNGILSEETNQLLAKKGFSHTAEYDSMITSYLETDEFPEKQSMNFDIVQKLRYGENPHQKGVFYSYHTLSKDFGFRQLQGKEISYNNLNDMDGVVRILRDFANHLTDEKLAVISKHTNPCGIATSDNLVEAFERAWNCDNVSAFGSVIGANSEFDKASAEFIRPKFVEVIIAPKFSEEALDVLKNKKNLRLIEIIDMDAFKNIPDKEYRFTDFGLLVQSRDKGLFEKIEVMCGKIEHDKAEEIVSFGMLALKNVKSNCIGIVREHKPGFFEQVGVGIGQPNRKDAVILACDKAISNLKQEFGEEYAGKLSGLFLFSDAFFPFSDNIEIAESYDIKNIVEPGGSVKDDEVIAAAKGFGMNLIFTGMRHFRH